MHILANSNTMTRYGKILQSRITMIKLSALFSRPFAERAVLHTYDDSCIQCATNLSFTNCCLTCSLVSFVS